MPVKIPRYPNGILAELNLPLEARQIPVAPHLAETYIQEKAAPLKKKSEQTNKDLTQTNLFNARDAYIFMRMKFFAAKGLVWQRGEGERANILTILEGVEVYADRDKKMLLWKKDFRKKRSAAANHTEDNAETSTKENGPTQTPDLSAETPAAQ